MFYMKWEIHRFQFTPTNFAVSVFFSEHAVDKFSFSPVLWRTEIKPIETQQTHPFFFCNQHWDTSSDVFVVQKS